jgi:curved DNA-binding protein CbpA
MTDDRNPYAVLGVTSVATLAEINHAFRAKLRALHPDTRGRDAVAAAGDTQLQQLIAAYQLLRDPENRARYDHTAAPQHSNPPPPQHNSASSDGPVAIPVTHHRRGRAADPDYPVWAGPVRRRR